MIDKNTILKISDDIIYRSVDGNLIIFPNNESTIDESYIFSGNNVANIIWKNIDGNNTVENIVDKIYKLYKVDYNELMNDTIVLLIELEELQLVKKVDL